MSTPCQGAELRGLDRALGTPRQQQPSHRSPQPCPCRPAPAFPAQAASPQLPPGRLWTGAQGTQPTGLLPCPWSRALVSEPCPQLNVPPHTQPHKRHDKRQKLPEGAEGRQLWLSSGAPPERPPGPVAAPTCRTKQHTGSTSNRSNTVRSQQQGAPPATQVCVMGNRRHSSLCVKGGLGQFNSS